MALPHARPGELIDLNAGDAERGTAASSSLLRTGQLQLLRVVVAAGHALPEHAVPGEATVHCLSGDAELRLPGGPLRLGPGQLVALAAGERHSVQAHADTVLLVTVLGAH